MARAIVSSAAAAAMAMKVSVAQSESRFTAKREKAARLWTYTGRAISPQDTRARTREREKDNAIVRA